MTLATSETRCSANFSNALLPISRNPPDHRVNCVMAILKATKIRRTWRQEARSRFFAAMVPSGHNRDSQNHSAHLTLPPAPAPRCPNLLCDGVAGAVDVVGGVVRIAIA